MSSSPPTTTAGPAADELATRTRRRTFLRIAPYLTLLYIVAYLDRVNVGYAALEMKTALGFSDQVLGFGAGIFFLGYFLFEVPGSLLVERWSARGWIARIMITWGILAAGMGLVRTPTQFHVLRF